MIASTGARSRRCDEVVENSLSMRRMTSRLHSSKASRRLWPSLRTHERRWRTGTLNNFPSTADAESKTVEVDIDLVPVDVDLDDLHVGRNGVAASREPTASTRSHVSTIAGTTAINVLI